MPSREPELYKDKIEVSLDGRQIFYLFFGGAVIVGLVFVLGVMVGRRVEARGHIDRADPSAVSDPLAALDRLERSDNLSFHGALTGSEAPTDVEKAIGEIEKHRLAGHAGKPEPVAAANPPVAPEVRTAKPETPTPSAPAPASHGTAADPADKPAADAHGEPMPRSDADKPRAEKRDDKRDADKRDDKRDADKRDGEKKPKKHDDGSKDHADGKKHGESATRSDAHADAARTGDADSRDRADGKSSDRSEARSKYTLQLSSFQDRSEAEAFLSATRSAGFQANLVEAEVKGKTFYRIRLGSYRSIDSANDAKADYEKAAKGNTAQVMHL